MKNNTFKRVLAGSLALLTVAAYVPANVGGILPDLSIVASAVVGNYVEANKQAGGFLSIAEDSVAFVENLYSITVDAGKYVYTPVTGTGTTTKNFILEEGKAYVLRTTAYMEDGETAQDDNLGATKDKDLNGEDLEPGFYEYEIDSVAPSVVAPVVTKKSVISKDNAADAFQENPTITQNGKEIVYDADKFGYEVAEGFPVSIAATPAENHTNMMLKVIPGVVKSQTKEGGVITLTFVPEEDAGAVMLSWATYVPTLQLTNTNGIITATDIGFNALVTNKVVGTYDFKYATKTGTTYAAASTNAKGEYIQEDESRAFATFTAQNVSVGNKTYKFFNDIDEDDFTVEKKLDDGTWKDNNYTYEDTHEVGTWRVTTLIEATADEDTAALSEKLKIVTEFTVVKQNVSSAANLAFFCLGVGDNEFTALQPSNGVYNVAWQNGDEISPNIVLYKNAEDAKNPSQADEDNPDKTYQEGKDKDYYVTGTTTASAPGTYTMTITPVKKAFNDGEEIVITWQILNSNNYVTVKKNVTNSAGEPAFEIAYRQASTTTLREQINKKLDFVGSTDLNIVKYTTLDGTEVSDPSEKANLGEYNDATGKFESDDCYIAYVANILKNDGKTSAMMKDGNDYGLITDPDDVIDDTTGLYKVYFRVAPTKVLIVPDITEITYGDDVELTNLYKMIDSVTKTEVGIPWKKGKDPKITLSDDNYQDETDTKNLPAGEYTYTVTDMEPRDARNYYVKQITAEDKVSFTVNARDLEDMDFGTVNVEVEPDAQSVAITKDILVAAANELEKNPTKFTNGNDFNISGGTTRAKVADLGKTFYVTLQGVGNFTGTKKVYWIVGDGALSDDVLSYEAEFDASKPRVMAKLDTSKVDGEIDECGFYYCNNGNMNDIPLDGFVDKDGVESNADGAVDAQKYLTNLFKEVDETGANKNQKGAKKITFTNKAVTTAQSKNGLLTAEIANSSVKKQVYIMPYVKYTNGKVAFGKVESFNYYDMVLEAEGALEMSKTDFVGDGKTGTAGQTYVKVDVTRVDKKGYEVERYGILYNNSDTWNDEDHPVPLAAAGIDQGEDLYCRVDTDELELAYTWLNLDNESEKTVKVAEVPAEDLATKIGTNTYIANTTAKQFDAKNNVKKDYGYGAKSVLARAFIQIKDAAGNSKVYYSHLADVTYGGFTVDATTGEVKGTEWAADNGKTPVTDSKNTTQILFAAPTFATGDYDDDKDGVKVAESVDDEGAQLTRMATSTGNKTFQVWWTDSKKS